MKQFGSLPRHTKRGTEVGVLISRASLFLILLLSMITFLSWLLKIPQLSSFANGMPRMMPETALVFLLCGCSFLLQFEFETYRSLRLSGKWLALVAIAVSISLHFNFGFHSKRPPPEVALGLCLCGLALLFFKNLLTRKILFSQTIGFFIGFWSEFFFIGYLTRSSIIYSLLHHDHTSGISLPSIFCFALFSVALISAHPTQGIASYVFSRASGGNMLRRAIWMVLIIPISVTGFIHLARRLGLQDPTLEDTFSISLTIAIFFLFAWKISKELYYSDQEKEKAVEDLEKSEAYWRQLISFAPEGILILNREGGILSLNERACTMTGYLESELRGTLLVNLISENDHSRFLSVLDAPPPVLSTDTHLRKKDGNSLPVEINTRHLPNGEIVTFLRDLTERKKSEDLLSQWKRLFENAGWGIAIGEVHGPTLGPMNPAYVKMHGYDSVEELMGKPISTVFPPELKDEARIHIEQAIDSGAHSFESVHIRKDGSHFPVMIDLSIVNDANGKPLYRAVNVRDISVEKSIQAQREFLENMPLYLNESLELEPTLEKIARLSVQDFSDWCLIDLISTANTTKRAIAVHRDPMKAELIQNYKKNFPLSPTPQRAIYQTILTKKPQLLTDVNEASLRSQHFEEDRIKAILQLGVHSYITTPLIARNQVQGSIAFVAASRNFSESDLQFAQEIANRAALAIDNARLYCEAKAATKAREDTLAIVSHDLKNPIAAIRLNAELLLRHTLPKTTSDLLQLDKIHKQLATIKRSACRAECLISDLLDFTKVEIGHFKVEKKDVSVSDILQEIQILMKPLADERNIQLFISSKEVTLIYCDHNRIIQALSNLIGNAIKFSPPAASIEVTATLSSPGEIIFSVKDQGVGMDAEALSHVFERYWQADENKGTGNGLGLAITKGIVSSHGGKIWAESQPDRGSTFSFTVPAPAQSQAGLTLAHPLILAEKRELSLRDSLPPQQYH